MYDNPRRRGGRGVAGARVRPVPVGAHQGTCMDYLRRHEREAVAAAHGEPAAKANFVANLLPRTADARNLRLAWDYLARYGGRAPGPDGLCYDDLDDGEVWKLLRTLRGAILDDSYRPGPDRKVAIPKNSGMGTRTLLLSSVIDRVVQRAVVQTVQPYLDPTFDTNSYGYRPGQDRQHALARAEQLATASSAWVWVTEDLKDAFDHVPQRRLLDVVRLRLADEAVVRLIGRVIQTGTGRGLRQGGCLSPLLLNLYLDHHLDRPWRKRHLDLPLLRVADDLLVLTHKVEEAHLAWSDLRKMLLPAGMPLKGTPSSATRDLTGGAYADWLGFRLFLGATDLQVRLAEKSWSSLRTKLELAHTEPDSPLRAVAAVEGWVDQLGPVYPGTNHKEVCARVETMAREQAFDEFPSREAFLSRWRKAYTHWSRIRSGTRQSSAAALPAAIPRGPVGPARSMGLDRPLGAGAAPCRPGRFFGPVPGRTTPTRPLPPQPSGLASGFAAGARSATAVASGP